MGRTAHPPICRSIRLSGMSHIAIHLDTIAAAIPIACMIGEAFPFQSLPIAFWPCYYRGLRAYCSSRTRSIRSIRSRPTQELTIPQSVV